MLRIPLSRLVSAVQAMVTLQNHVSTAKGATLALHPDNYQTWLTAADNLAADCEAMNLLVIRRLATLIAGDLRTAAVDMTSGDMIMRDHHLPQLDAHLRGFTQVIRIETEARAILVLSPDKAALYERDEPHFGPEVAASFPSAAEDIEEAGKCLALGRSTAAVFHLMRAMEIAVRAMATKLGIAKIDLPWGPLLSDINKEIEALPKGAARDQWSQSSTHLYHVKQAWRNEVMHPKATYTDEQATEVFAAVRSFMRHLAPLTQ
ncbi:HEPN domain-containing protein [Rivibacter subsaxonicus]|uniref:HEPN domain-containing protein n=1 Tax=Rivibacter subsaxonicus TaxID=457575 RepID=A0A4Q7VGX3_9BURK|nr:HEPN domain-containing protein [Rivibacter subsaxonicus]RZT95299.1 HEPN domain-containing protein [Rivibacter subsaxonicus]